MIVLLALLAAGSATPPAPSAAPSVEALSRLDARGTATAMKRIADTVAALPEADRAAARDHLRWLQVSDPYTRAAFTLPLALEAEVRRIPADTLPRWVQSEWSHLQAGLRDHVAVLDLLGVDLPPPAPGDALGGQGSPFAIDRRTLETSRQPVGLAGRLLGAIPGVTPRFTAEAQQALVAHADAVEALTGVRRPCPRGPWADLPGHPWTLGMQLAGWHDALRRVEPFVEDAHDRARVKGMIALLDGWTRVSAP